MNGTETKLAAHVEIALRQTLSALTGKEYGVASAGRPQNQGELEDPAWWQQSFNVTTGPALWLGAGRDLWEFMGRAVLEAAGIDEASEEDCRSTWQEIVSQTIAGIAGAITADVLNEVSTSSGQALIDEPAGLSWSEFIVDTGDGGKHAFRAAWSDELEELYQPKPTEVRSAGGRDSSVSKTFDLLLEVALPVSVSFGRTMLQIREVLKLNTGSIVELDRLVSDPVEVIVNDCVIARGEVVVVDGNYGVRVSQLASREDRLRTGIADSARIGARP